MKLSEVISVYVTHKRALGYRFQAEEYILRSFCKNVGNGAIANITPHAVLAFLDRNGPITGTWARKHRALSGLFKFAQKCGLLEVAPLPRVVPKPTTAAFVPYIYSHEEIKRLIDAVPMVCAGRVPIEEGVLRTLLLLLYGAGLRISEALALTLDGVDLHRACLYIRGTKFFKSRLVPLGTDLNAILTAYIIKRHEGYVVSVHAPLFCFLDGSPLSQSSVRNAFRQLRSYAGVRREGGPRCQPRLHDLRHTAAVHRLIAWYKNGADLQELLPKLAIYLGHKDLSSTQTYLTMTAELLEQASLRFERYALGGRL